MDEEKPKKKTKKQKYRMLDRVGHLYEFEATEDKANAEAAKLMQAQGLSFPKDLKGWEVLS